MTIWAQEAKIVRLVIVLVTIYVIDLDGQLLPVPFGTEATLNTLVLAPDLQEQFLQVTFSLPGPPAQPRFYGTKSDEMLYAQS